MAQKLAMKDFLTFKPMEVLENKKHLFECRDEKSDTGSSLIVRLEATHSGLINGNWRFYRPDRMQSSVFNWVMPGRPQKPVLARHDEQADPLGRVLRATYKDDSYQYAKEFPIIRDTIFYNTDGKKRVNLHDSIDWIVDNLQPLEDYRGLGYTELGVKITQPDAIRKVLADEYLTVSVGFDTDQAICSVCHTDWAVDDKCEHKPGTRVDKKRAFLIAGNFNWHEVSFINFPADPFAGVIDKGPLKDSLNQMFFLGLPLRDQDLIVSRSNLAMSDSLNFTSDIQVLTEEESMILEGGQMSDKQKVEAPDVKVDTTTVVAPVQDTSKPEATPAPAAPVLDLAKILDEVNAPELKPERAFEIQTILKEFKPEGIKDTKLFKRAVSTVNAVIRKNGWEDTKSTPDKADVERKIATLIDVLRDMSKEARVHYVAQVAEQAKAVGIEFTSPDLDHIDPEPEWTVDQLPEEDRAYFADTDKLYDDLLAEMASAVTDSELDITPEALNDAKLSAASRKKLKSSTFCGPGKSFPVTDCAHVTAARRLIGKASVSTDTKSKILACVSRKASAMGCGGPKKDEVSIVDALVAAKLLDAVEPDKSPKVTKGFVDHLQGLHSEYHKSDPDMHYWMCDAVSALGEHWRTGQALKFHQKYLAENAKDFVVLPVTEVNNLQDAVNSATEDTKKKAASIDSWQKMTLSLVESLKDSKATQIVMFRMMTGVQGYQGLTLVQFNDKVKELAKRTRESLEDTLEDVVEQLKGFTATVKVETDGAKPEEVAREVKDSIVLDPPASPEKSVVEGTDSTPNSVPETVLQVKDPRKRKIMQAYFRASELTAKK